MYATLLICAEMFWSQHACHQHDRSPSLDCTRCRCLQASSDYYDTQRRYNYVTPKSYLELIGFYKFLLDQKRTEVQRQIDRLDVGLSTLRKTAADVAELQVDLKHTMVKVSRALKLRALVQSRKGSRGTSWSKKKERTRVALRPPRIGRKAATCLGSRFFPVRSSGQAWRSRCARSGGGEEGSYRGLDRRDECTAGWCR